MHFQPVEPMADDDYIAQGHDSIQVDLGPNDALDDVFGSGPSSPTEERGAFVDSSSAHPSDMRRLQSEHTTAGYREGVTVAKDKSLQAGFDEGFSLGASVGLRAGQLLGTLEAIADAVRGHAEGDAEKAANLVKEAHDELADTASIFSAEYWAEDGNWKFEVKASEGGQADDEVVFADVAAAHPLIRKWAAIVDEQITLWRIDQTVLDDDTGRRLDSIMDEPILSSATPETKKPLDW